jgi:hypothetical protein
MYLLDRSGSLCLGVAVKYDLHKNIEYVNVCAGFEMLEVMYFLIFSLLRDFRRAGTDVTHVLS